MHLELHYSFLYFKDTLFITYIVYAIYIPIYIV